MNRERTERIITQILRQPDRFAMAQYVTPGYIYEPEDEDDPEGPWREVDIDPCGTACCFAGWAVVNDKADDLIDITSTPYTEALTWAARAHGGTYDWSANATVLLELPDTSFTPPLFFAPEWPYHYRDLADNTSEAVAGASLLRDMLDGAVRLTFDEADRADEPDDDGFVDSYARQCAWWAQFATTNTTQEV